MQNQADKLPCTLLDLFRNQLVLNHVSPYLGVSNLVRLAATSKDFRNVIDNTSGVYHHVDLTRGTLCVGYFGSLCLDRTITFQEGWTRDDYFAQHLRQVFRSLQSRNVLQDVRTLILDRITLSAGIVREILCSDGYNVRILSLRGVRELDDEGLMHILWYLIRSDRPEGTPRLKGLYYFTPETASANFSVANLLQRVPQRGITNALGAQLGSGVVSSGALHKQFVRSSWHQYDPWYSATGEVLKREGAMDLQWATLIQACAGLIAFDVVLCRHNVLQRSDHRTDYPADMQNPPSSPRLATISLSGCRGCGSCPEGPARPGTSAENQIPLVAPPPLHTSSVRSAQRLDTRGLPQPPFIARCKNCLKDRWCERCNVWWCESCYTIPSRRTPESRSVIQPGTSDPSVKVHNHLCVANCLMDELLNGVGEGGMWG